MNASDDRVLRTDLSLPNDPGINIFVRAATIPDGTHYLFNDRPERGRSRFLAEVLAFLADDERS
jgi:hypothetical protein